MNMTLLLALSLALIAGERYILAPRFGAVPFLMAEGKLRWNLVFGLAALVILTLSALGVWLAGAYVLAPFGLDYLRPPLMLGLTVGLCALSGWGVKKALPQRYEQLGETPGFLLLVTAVLGLCFLTGAEDAAAALYTGLATGSGFAVALALAYAVRRRLEGSEPPKAFQGLPLALVTAGLVVLAFWGV